MEYKIESLPKLKTIPTETLKMVRQRFEGINEKPPAEKISILFDTSRELDAPIIEIDKAWVPNSPNRLRFTDLKNCRFDYKGGSMSEEAFLNRYLKKCKNRNVILLFSDLFGFTKMIIF